MSAPAPALRALRVGEVLDKSITLYGRHFGPLVKAVLVIVVPVQILSQLITASTAPEESYTLDASTIPDSALNETGEWAAYITGQVLVGMLGLMVIVITTAACFKAVSDAYLGGRPDWRDSLRFAMRHTHSLVWLLILSMLLLIPALIPLAIPFVWLAIAWVVAPLALLFEGARGRHALRRSFNLVRGRWWPTFGTILIATIIATVVQGVFGAFLGLLFFVDGVSPLFSLVAAGVVGILGTALTTPFQAAIITLIYFDLRVRKEGFDLQLLAERMGTTPEPSASLAPTVPPVTGQPPAGYPPPAGGYPPFPAGPAPAGYAPPSPGHAPAGYPSPAAGPYPPAPGASPAGYPPAPAGTHPPDPAGAPPTGYPPPGVQPFGDASQPPAPSPPPPAADEAWLPPAGASQGQPVETPHEEDPPEPAPPRQPPP